MIKAIIEWQDPQEILPSEDDIEVLYINKNYIIEKTKYYKGGFLQKNPYGIWGYFGIDNILAWAYPEAKSIKKFEDQKPKSRN